jgi:hypothetical protein
VEGGAPDGNAAAHRSEGDSLSVLPFAVLSTPGVPKPFCEALIEIERPPHPDQDRAGFTCCEALGGIERTAGQRLRPGEPPDAHCGDHAGAGRRNRDATMRAQRRSVRSSAGQGKGGRNGRAGAEQIKEETRNAKDVWQPGGVERDLINVGPSLYRQIGVEVK